MPVFTLACLSVCLGMTGSACVALGLSGRWLSAFVLCTSAHTCESVYRPI